MSLSSEEKKMKQQISKEKLLEQKFKFSVEMKAIRDTTIDRTRNCQLCVHFFIFGFFLDSEIKFLFLYLSPS